MSWMRSSHVSGRVGHSRDQRLLREAAPRALVVGAVPDCLERGGAQGRTVVEGVVEDVVACEGRASPLTRSISVPDRVAVQMTLRLAREEALLVEGVVGSRGLRRNRGRSSLGKGKRVVTLFADTGETTSRPYFDGEWRERHGMG